LERAGTASSLSGFTSEPVDVTGLVVVWWFWYWNLLSM
jgi:hypothetical protein